MLIMQRTPFSVLILLYCLLLLSTSITHYTYYTHTGGVGGYAVAIDIDNEVLYTVPAMGKAGYESAAFAGKQTEKTDKVVAVIGDDQVQYMLHSITSITNICISSTLHYTLYYTTLYSLLYYTIQHSAHPTSAPYTDTITSGCCFVHLAHYNYYLQCYQLCSHCAYTFTAVHLLPTTLKHLCDCCFN